MFSIAYHGFYLLGNLLYYFVPNTMQFERYYKKHDLCFLSVFAH